MFKVLLAFSLACSATLAADTGYPDASNLPSQPGWPDPLLMRDGKAVTTEKQWRTERRPELLALFQHYMYGTIPPKPDRIEFKVEATYPDFLDRKATLKLVTISFGDAAAPKIDLLLAVPNGTGGRVPVFLAINFCGNHAVTPDPRVPLTRGWIYGNCTGSTNSRATEACRGSQAKDWDLAQIIGRGYALATFCNSDLDSDRANVSDGVYAWLARKAGQPVPTRDRGSIAAWAWGFHRCVDYLLTEPGLDPKGIAVVGHSRNGKTALLAAAFDERIALCIPLQAGCGGTAPSRGKIGESVKQINTSFPHWFNAAFKQFNDRTDRLPFDQHCLVALMAPRPVLLANALEDQWANPSGQFEMLLAAEPVYRLLKADGLASPKMPELEHLSAGKLGYYIRPGKHSMTRQDWGAFLDFADVQLKGK
jgi:hypothetical protein